MTNKQISKSSIVDAVPPFARIQMHTVFRRFDDATVMRVQSVFREMDEMNPDLSADDLIDITASTCDMPRERVISCLWDATRPPKPEKEGELS